MELWDVYNEKREKTGKTIDRHSDDKLGKGEYHLVTEAIIINSDKKILLSKRAEFKQKFPLMWEFTGGSVKQGETTLEAILRELKEELNINLKKDDAKLYKTVKDDDVNDFKDIWIFYANIKLSELNFNDNEVIDAKWVDIKEIKNMIDKNEIVPTIDFSLNDLKQLLA